MTPITIFLWILPFWAIPPVDETIVLDIVRNKKVLGELKATKAIIGDWAVYESQTTINTRIVTKIEVRYLSSAKFSNGRLEEAKVEMTVNGSPHSKTMTKRVGNNYQFYKDGKLDKTISGSITNSSLMLLFKEPVGIEAVYSEEGGSFYSILSSGFSSYNKVNAKGRTSKYQYKNQILQSIAIDAGLVEFDMVLKGPK